jgi:hypothetical protein
MRPYLVLIVRNYFMTAQLLDGKAIASALKQDLKAATALRLQN